MALKITFEDGGAIWVAASGEVMDFQPKAFGQPIGIGDVVLDPQHARTGAILEYQCHRYGTIREFVHPIKSIEDVEVLKLRQQ